MSYILILTLSFGVLSSQKGYGTGGIATAEFDSLAACEAAASAWKEGSKIELKRNGYTSSVHHLTRSALCMPKGDLN